jgi:tetratricopeptide (TPR) repeat protein
VLGCAGQAPAELATESPGEIAPSDRAAKSQDPAALIERAEAALAADDPARAVALFARALDGPEDDTVARQAYPGLARAHELLNDYNAAIRAYDAYLTRFSDAEYVGNVYARRGACEAEIEQWERSANSYELARKATSDAPPSFQVEMLTRRGYALFQVDAFDQADKVLAEANEVYEQAMARETERFSTYYFVGMARFYRAAIIHRKFREVSIQLPEAQMTKDFEQKLALLVEAQEAYNDTVKAKHVFWVSAAGYQLGSLFEEFYDALMYAPVPDWLDEKQRQIYYEELKKQLRPVVDKAIWVFEKNLETARRLGYENPFIDETEKRLSQLQSVLLSGDTNFGKPHPRVAPPDTYAELAPPEQLSAEQLPAVERKLYVPLPTPL